MSDRRGPGPSNPLLLSLTLAATALPHPLILSPSPVAGADGEIARHRHRAAPPTTGSEQQGARAPGQGSGVRRHRVRGRAAHDPNPGADRQRPPHRICALSGAAAAAGAPPHCAHRRRRQHVSPNQAGGITREGFPTTLPYWVASAQLRTVSGPGDSLRGRQRRRNSPWGRWDRKPWAREGLSHG